MAKRTSFTKDIIEIQSEVARAISMNQIEEEESKEPKKEVNSAEEEESKEPKKEINLAEEEESKEP